MNIWLPYISSKAGSDIYTERLASGLMSHGHRVEISRFPHIFQDCPDALRCVSPPTGTQIVLANSWNGFAFKRSSASLVVVEHHCVLDSEYRPHLSGYERWRNRSYEWRSFRSADAVVTVSDYTRDTVKRLFQDIEPRRIYNGIDTTFYSPSDGKRERPSFNLLYVGNHSHRKGTDLLSGIMSLLPNTFCLRCTDGMRDRRNLPVDERIQHLGRLSDEELRREYRDSDALLCPTRYEGFGYTLAEAMACGTPVIATDCSSVPEIVLDGVTGTLCRRDNIQDFADAAKRFANNNNVALSMSWEGVRRVRHLFSIDRMIHQYESLFRDLQRNPPRPH